MHGHPHRRAQRPRPARRTACRRRRPRSTWARRVGRPKLALAGLVSRIDAELIVGDIAAAEADVGRVEALLGREPDPPVQHAARLLLPPPPHHRGRGSKRPKRPTTARFELRRVGVALVGRRGEHTSRCCSTSAASRAGSARCSRGSTWAIGDERVLMDNLHAQVLVEEGRLGGGQGGARPTAGIRRPIEDWWWIAEAITATELACELEDIELGAELRGQLLPFSGLLACNGHDHHRAAGRPVPRAAGPPPRRPTSRLATTCEAALDMAVRIGAPSFEAQSALRLGLLLREDGDLPRPTATSPGPPSSPRSTTSAASPASCPPDPLLRRAQERMPLVGTPRAKGFRRRWGARRSWSRRRRGCGGGRRGRRSSPARRPGRGAPAWCSRPPAPRGRRPARCRRPRR